MFGLNGVLGDIFEKVDLFYMVFLKVNEHIMVFKVGLTVFVHKLFDFRL